MPVFNRRGQAVYGRGLALIAINGIAQAAAVGGGPVWLTDEHVLFNRQQDGDVWHTGLYQPASGDVASIGPAGNDRVAGGGIWAIRNNGGYRDSEGRTSTEWCPLAVDDETGDIAVCTSFHSTPAAGLSVLTRDGATVIVHAGALSSLEACFRGGTLAYEAGGELRFWRRDGQQPAPIRNILRGVRHSGGWRVGFSDAHTATVVHRIGESTGYVVSRGHADFVPDICAMPDGRVLFASCTGAGELPHEFKLVTLDTAAHERIDLGSAAPAPVPPPSSEPEPAPAISADWLKPWPRPVWVVPYQSFNSVRYGDTTDFVGNAALVIREDASQSTADVQAHARRVASKGYPLVIQREAYTPDIAALVIALYVHASSVDGLSSEVAAIEQAIGAGTLPDVPVIAYLDLKVWPAHPPAGLDPSRHWLSPQLYRDGGESVAAFMARAWDEQDKLDDWGFRLMPTWHAYDRNGLGTEAEALEIQPLVLQWGHAFNWVGFMPFSDMRRGEVNGKAIGGLQRYPRLKALVRAIARMNPEGRPNRFSYWTPRRTDANAVLRNILGQDRELVQLSAAQKARLLAMLSAPAASPAHDTPTPGGPVPFVDSDVQLLNGPDTVFSWPITSTITRAMCGGGQLCVDHTKRGQWPVVPFFDTDGTIEGNQYVFACINGRWYGGANEWVRPGQECKAVESHAIGAHAFSREPLKSWVPKNGEVFGVMMSTPARAYPAMTTVNERSNVVFVEWRD